MKGVTWQENTKKNTNESRWQDKINIQEQGLPKNPEWNKNEYSEAEQRPRQKKCNDKDWKE